MESGSLLFEQEEAFRKLNAELELRTRRLMKEVEDAIHKKDSPLLWESDTSTTNSFKFQDDPRRELNNHARICESNFSSDSESGMDYGGRWGRGGSPAIKEILSPPIRRSHSPHHNRRTAPPLRPAQPTPPRKTTPKHLARSVGDISDDFDDSGILPPGAKGIGSEGLLRVLKAKVKMLQDELSTTQQDLAKKADDAKRLQTGLRQAEEERSKAVQELVQTREKVKRSAAQTACIADKLTLRDNENAILKKEIEMLKQDLKKINLSTSGCEIKLNNAKDEVERLKQELKKSQTKEKETRDQCRIKVENLVASVRKLEKQKSQLNSAFKKQLALIDNLKKQKSTLETGKAVKFTEEEFLKLLDWAPAPEVIPTGSNGVVEEKIVAEKASEVASS